MCHQPIFESARVSADSFDFNPIFTYIEDSLSAPDILIGNFETVTAGKDRKYTGYPQFNTPDDYVAALKNAGFDFLVTSNNHCLDRGESGVLRTLEILQSTGIPSTGTFKSQSDRDSVRIISLNGISIAILNYTYGTNGMPVPKGKEWLVNLIDTALIKSDIEKAVSYSPDLITVFYHFGTEYKREPDAYQKKIVEFTKRAGADLIIGSHPHVIERMEFFSALGGRLDTGYVVYSLGNFLSNQQWRYSDAGVIVNLDIEKNLHSGKCRIREVRPVPTLVYISRFTGKKQYYILPAGESTDSTRFEFLSKNDLKRLTLSTQDTRSILYSTAE